MTSTMKDAKVPARVSLLVVLAVLFLGTVQLPVTTCELQTVGNVGARIQAGSASAYDVMLGAWQAIFGATIGSGRTFSLICFVLTLALVYRFTGELLGSRFHLFLVTLLAAATGMASRLPGSGTMDAWLAFLSVLSTWLLWRIMHSVDRARLAALVLYGVSVALIIASRWALWAVIPFHLVYLFMASRHRITRVLLLASTLIWVIASKVASGIVLSATAALFSPQNTFDTLVRQTPPVLLGLVALGIAAVAFGLFDALSLRVAGQNTGQCFIALWLLVPLAAMVLLGAFDPVMALVLSIPAAIALIHTVSAISLRAQVMLSLLIAAWLLPYGPVANGQAVRQDIYEQTGGNVPIIIDMLEPCFIQSGIVGTLYASHTGSPVYVHLDSGAQWATLGSTGEIRLVNTAPSLSAVPDYWTIEAVNAPPGSGVGIPNDGVLLYQRNYETAQLQHFSRQPVETISPDHEVIYRVGPLALLKFNVLPETTVGPGTTLLFNSWWTAPDAVDDNYLIKAELLDSKGMSVTYGAGLLAKSYSSTWERRTVHYDQQTLPIPDNIPSGPYSLIITVHGSTDTNNLPFIGMDGASTGAYAYLTTINIVR